MKNLGILGCSEIAFRRFMPAAQKTEGLHVVAVAEEYSPSKLENFCNTYGIEGEDSFHTLISRDDIDCIYVPQPPALHYKWAKEALMAGKHVMVEKPSTISFTDSQNLVNEARMRSLALHENYMFIYHPQIKKIKEILDSGKLGEVRLIRGDFGFPIRAANDFRYNKQLGGGALLDAGGYTVKLAALLLDSSIKVDTSCVMEKSGYEVEISGSISMSNDEGVVYQAGYGMDNSYSCSVEIWGSKGKLKTNRIFTAPSDFEPVINITTQDGTEDIRVEAYDHFAHSIRCFLNDIDNEAAREEDYRQILLQSKLVDQVREKDINHYWGKRDGCII